MIDLTVITTTYNRADLLPECWRSLKAQTCKNFQWLVVDDGSTDGTNEVISKIIETEPEYVIDYVSKPNGGKHTALNYSHPYIKGKYVLILDSDDILTENAVELVLNSWSKYESNSEVGQVIFLKGFSENDPICYVANENQIVDTLKEPRIGKVGRDCCDVYRTELFKKHPFPVFEGERFIGEGSAFFFIEKESRGVYFNKVICLCEYREDGLTKAGKTMRLKNPMGGRYNSMVYMDKCLPMKTRFKKSILYTCYSLVAKVPMKKIFSEQRYKFLTLLGFFPGILLFFYWSNKFLN